MTTDDWAPTQIEGVLHRRQRAIADDRGSFMEVWRESFTSGLLLADEEFVQANLSRSRAGVLRGMHFHRQQVDLWILLEGRAVAATTDLRAAMAGNGAPHSQAVQLEPGDALFIPRLVAHGFWALEDLALLYLVSNEYDGTDEHGFAWNDTTTAIPWPGSDPVLSERDQRNPPLDDLLASLRQS